MKEQEPPKHEHLVNLVNLVNLVHVANAWLNTDIPLEERVEMDEHLTTAKDAMDPEKPGPEGESDEKPGEDTENKKDKENEDDEEAKDNEDQENQAQLPPEAVPPSEELLEDLPELKAPSQSKAQRQAKDDGKGEQDGSDGGQGDGGEKGSFKGPTHRSEGASNASKIRIAVHVNGQQLPGHLDFLPRGSVAQQMGPQTCAISSGQMAAQSLPKPRIRPTTSLSTPSMPSVLPSSQSKKKRNNKKKKDKTDKNKKDKESDFEYQNHSRREVSPFKEARPRIAPSQAPEHQKNSIQPKVTKVLQSTPKILPRPRDRRAKDDFIQVIREKLRSQPRPGPTSAASVASVAVASEADDRPKVAKMELEYDEYDDDMYDDDTYVKQDIKEEFDEDW